MEEDALIAIAIYLASEKKKKKKKKVKRFWVKEWFKKRNTFSHHNRLDELRLSSPSDYRSYLRMDHPTFLELLDMVKPFIFKKNTHLREAIPPHQRLSCTLRFLATGANFEELKFITAISPQSIGKIVIETCEAITTVLKNNIKMPASEEEWKATSEEFEKNWNFNHCLGAIDGKHIDITKPQESGSYYFNYKHNFSIVLMAVCNANYEFMMVAIGSNGRVSDGGVFSNTLFSKHLQEKKLKLPKPDHLPGIDCNMPYVFVADDAIPLSDNLMKPYSQRNLIKEKRIFNYRLSRARRVIENSFGILSSRFRILLKTINLSPEKATIIVRTCCHLHNHLRRKNMDIFLQESFDTENVLTGEVEPGSWRSENHNLTELQPAQSRNSPSTAKEIRDQFCHYFNTSGAVHWQDNMI